MTTTLNYLKTFFEEKVIGYEMFEIDVDGMTHMMDNETIIETIISGGVPDSELTQIANTIRKIDFMNGNINHFLKHLAVCLARNY